MENLQINESLELGKRIAFAIARSGRKKKDIAVELGYSPQAVTGWEKLDKRDGFDCAGKGGEWH